MAEVQASNSFQELFVGLDYFKTNLAKERIKDQCNVSDQAFNKWWTGKSWPNPRNMSKLLNIIISLKHE